MVNFKVQDDVLGLLCQSKRDWDSARSHSVKFNKLQKKTINGGIKIYDLNMTKESRIRGLQSVVI